MNWRSTTLGELCAVGGGGVQTGPFGSQLHAADYVFEGIPSVMPQNIGDNVIDERDIARITAEDASRLRKYLLAEGDIVYSRRGDVEKRALVRGHNVGWLCGTGCLRVRVGDPNRADARFVSYLLGTPENRAWISQHAVGATMPNLNTQILSSVPLRVPEIEEQRAIAELLGAFDDKIDANTRLARSAIEYADLLFPQQPPWPTLQTLDEVVETTKGVSYRSADLAAGTAALVTLKSFSRDGRYAPTGLKPYVGPFKTEQVVLPGEIVVAQTDLTQAAEVVGRAVRVPKSSRYETLVASLDLAVVRAKPGINSTYLLGLLRQRSFREHCRARASGTTVLHLRRGVIETYRTHVGDKSTQERYAAVVNPLYQMEDNLIMENRALAELRDTLLPELMSGRLRVKDAEKKIEEVV